MEAIWSLRRKIFYATKIIQDLEVEYKLKAATNQRKLEAARWRLNRCKQIILELRQEGHNADQARLQRKGDQGSSESKAINEIRQNMQEDLQEFNEDMADYQGQIEEWQEEIEKLESGGDEMEQ